VRAPARAVGAILLTIALPTSSRAQPADARVAIARGDSLMARLDTPAAIDAYRHGVASDPEDVELLWKLARALSNRTAETAGPEGDQPLHEEAVEIAHRAVAAGPGTARTHTMLAVALGRYGRWLAHECRIRCAGNVVDMGREAYYATRRAIEIDPYDPAPLIVLGVYHRELSTVPMVVKVVARTFLGGYPPVSLRQSAVSLERAIRLEPNDVTAHLELARTYRAMGRRSDARAEIEKALAAPVHERLDVVEKAEAEALLAELD
jgi:tetratricopeptide (TPR) repeat protein